ncbi:MAG: helix-turn-helix domain-containing protein [candidate division WOR-3 bacterium]
MVSFEYQTVLKVDPVLTQQEVVGTCFENCCGNISETARICGVSRNTTRKILRRFEKEGEEGLKNKSRRPKNSQERQALKLKRWWWIFSYPANCPRAQKKGYCYLLRHGLEDFKAKWEDQAQKEDNYSEDR